jgi:hypothetical protein
LNQNDIRKFPKAPANSIDELLKKGVSDDNPKKNKSYHRRNLWANKIRSYSLSVDIGKFTAAMDSLNFDAWYKLLDLLMELSARGKGGPNNYTKAEIAGLKQDIKDLNITGVRQFLDKKIESFRQKCQVQDKFYKKIRWNFEYHFSKMIVYMTKREKAFICAKVDNMSGEHAFQEDSCDVVFKTKRIRVYNPSAKTDKER